MPLYQTTLGNIPAGTRLVPYSARISSNATTTPTSTVCYVSSISITVEAGGTGSTIVIRDKSGTPLILVDGLVTTAINTTPNVLNFETPVKMIGGIDIITAGVAAATVSVWINYYQ